MLNNVSNACLFAGAIVAYISLFSVSAITNRTNQRIGWVAGIVSVILAQLIIHLIQISSSVWRTFDILATLQSVLLCLFTIKGVTKSSMIFVRLELTMILLQILVTFGVFGLPPNRTLQVILVILGGILLSQIYITEDLYVTDGFTVV
jgi:uncharacterized membrane protein YhaH (DUF805 family)